MYFHALRTVALVAFGATVAIAESPAIAFQPPLAEPATVVVVASPVAAQPRLPTEADMRRYAAIIRGASRAHGIEGELVHAIIWAESSFNPDAVSRAGAGGLMQLMPETAKSYGVDDVFDPEQNIRAGVKMMAQLLAQFDGDVELALAAYNAGSNAVVRAGNRIPPYPETEAYVPKVLDYYRRLQARKA